MVRKSIEFIFFGSIFISFCTVAMCMETSVLLGLPFSSLNLYSFVFGATLVHYNLHYLLKTSAVAYSKRFAWSQRKKPMHRFLILLGTVFMGTSFVGFGRNSILLLIIVGIIALMYSFPLIPFGSRRRIKDFGILKILTLVLSWSLITVLLPVDPSYYNELPLILVFCRRFIFMFALCLLFDVRDESIDRKGNIKTIPVVAGVRNSYLICYLSVIIFILLSVVNYLLFKDARGLSAMLLSALATVFAIEYTKRNKSDLVFLLCVDGMMLLQAALVMMGLL